MQKVRILMDKPERFDIGTGNSNWQGDPYIIDLLHLYNPQVALDLGVGKWGKFGFLFRRSFEDWRKICYGESNRRILHGVEGHQGNYDILCGSCWYYNLIFNEEITRWLEKHSKDHKYDLAFLGDVLEHFDFATAKWIILRLRMICKVVIVQMPIGEYPQEVPDNKLETHRHSWTFEDVQTLKPSGLKIFNDFLGRPFVVFSII